MERNVRSLVCGAILALLSLPGSLGAQECRLLCAPVFVFQPGLITTDFLDAPEGADSETNFNFRVVTAIPTTIPRTTLVGIVQWTPFNEVDTPFGEHTANAPSFVYGPVFSLLNTPLLSVDFDVLGAFGPAGEADDRSDYTHKLLFEGDVFLKLGQAMAMQGSWSNFALYGMLAHVVTGIPDEASPWVLLTGVSLPIAPWQ